ncbi:DUF2971 domain-containing protein [Bacillus safensis]|uniref:DUF2971 domain-containing protein n=1 Tax=Bacillus safensis TaxID=561879 RepID=UPI000BF4CE00|nr:DUF2971 domain-containing protein [Bacillus safensis]MCM2985596.1 DUF2971 domain-containing protein [Bacillus safensis]MCY7446688.1 DUF2971 domain-containing protein [Bacillus safensis]MCY7457430.1 DUF2971 domain-containing protein [Bacillus safensis]PGC67170.1 hypothetical protein COL97_03030 [Bacillus safensis]
MNLEYKRKAYEHAMNFESVYDYSEQYKVDGNPTVWKFVDLGKLNSLLMSKAMYFSKPNKFEDPLEGSYSNWEVEQYKDDGELLASREYMKKIQEFAAISCWHMNRHESAAMWDLYLGGHDGVAIKTNCNDLINSINDLRYRVFFGKLQYIDFKKEMTSRNIYDTLFYKRKSFSHENELRLMIIASRVDAQYLEGLFERECVPSEKWYEKIKELERKSYEFSCPNGNLVSCELNRLIQKIYVSPRSSKEIVKKVKEMVSKSGLTPNKVIQSDLYSDFIY